MSNKWYFLVKGKIQGPITENQVREKLRTSELTLNDIIFREGDSKWKRVNEFPENNFSKEVQSDLNLHHFVKLPKNSDVPEKWVVLLNIQTDAETKFVQKGPYSLEEVKDAIQRGEVSYSDHIWKVGFDKWQRIGDLEEFSFKGETQIFGLSSLNINSTPETKRNANNADSISGVDDFKTAIISNIKAEIKKEILEQKPAEPAEKTSSFSLRIDQTRLNNLINKASSEKNKIKLEEKTITRLETTKTKSDVVGGSDAIKIPSVIPPKDDLQIIAAKPQITFDEELDNRKEPTVWTTNIKTKTRSIPVKRGKKKTWNTIFKITQFALLAVVIGLGFAIFQNIEKRNQKIREKLNANSVSVTEPKKEFKKYPVIAASPSTPKTVDDAAKIPSTVTKREQPFSAPPAVNVDPAVGEGDTEANISVPEQTELASKTPAKEIATDIAPIEPRKGSAYLKVKLVGPAGPSPKLVILSNANEGEKIALKITAVTGEVLGLPSFTVDTQVKRRRQKEIEINLKNYGIRPGYYMVMAQLADAKFKLDHVFIGNKKLYEKNLYSYRKTVSYRQQWEKKSLLKVSTETIDLTKQLFSKYAGIGSMEEWQSFYQKWKTDFRNSSLPEMKAISQKNQNNFAYPDVWYDLRDFREKLVGEAESLNSAFLAARKSASLPNGKLLNDIGSLVSKVGELSGWRQKASR